MSLKLEPVANAIARLEEAVQLYASSPENLLQRDGLIQRFEFTYELAFNLLKRYVRENASSVETANSAESEGKLSFSHVIRESWAFGLLNEPVETWQAFREGRNLTSHTYNEPVAEEVCAMIPQFLAEVKWLHSELVRRNGA